MAHNVTKAVNARGPSIARADLSDFWHTFESGLGYTIGVARSNNWKNAKDP